MTKPEAVKEIDHSTAAAVSDVVFEADAYESCEEISAERRTKAEEKRRSEIAEQYSIYEPYGMSYNQENDRFFYNGQIVRYFKDEISTENTNSFFFEDGVVDIEPIRDASGALTGVKQLSDADFQMRTQKQEAIRQELEDVGVAGISGSFEQGDLNKRDDSLEAYTAFGVSYDKNSDNWLYDGKTIHILYDEGYSTYCDNGIRDGICLKVIRDQKNNIEKLVKTGKQELERYVN